MLLGTASLGLVGPNAEAVATGATAARRILELMDKQAAINSMSEEGIIPDAPRGDIRFENVQFSYPTRPDVRVLTNFDLSLPAGSTTALVGASGCGKSTIIKLLQRFYDPSRGTIYLDNHPLTALSLKWLRENIAVVNQEPDLFNASIYDNIRYGFLRSKQVLTEQQTRDKIMDAAESANIHHIIMDLPDGYETNVGERGSKLSGARLSHCDDNCYNSGTDMSKAVNGKE